MKKMLGMFSELLSEALEAQNSQPSRATTAPAAGEADSQGVGTPAFLSWNVHLELVESTLRQYSAVLGLSMMRFERALHRMVMRRREQRKPLLQCARLPPSQRLHPSGPTQQPEAHAGGTAAAQKSTSPRQQQVAQSKPTARKGMPVPKAAIGTSRQVVTRGSAQSRTAATPVVAAQRRGSAKMQKTSQLIESVIENDSAQLPTILIGNESFTVPQQPPSSLAQSPAQESISGAQLPAGGVPKQSILAPPPPSTTPSERTDAVSSSGPQSLHSRIKADFPPTPDPEAISLPSTTPRTRDITPAPNASTFPTPLASPQLSPASVSLILPENKFQKEKHPGADVSTHDSSTVSKVQGPSTSKQVKTPPPAPARHGNLVADLMDFSATMRTTKSTSSRSRLDSDLPSSRSHLTASNAALQRKVSPNFANSNSSIKRKAPKDLQQNAPAGSTRMGSIGSSSEAAAPQESKAEKVQLTQQQQEMYFSLASRSEDIEQLEKLVKEARVLAKVTQSSMYAEQQLARDISRQPELCKKLLEDATSERNAFEGATNSIAEIAMEEISAADGALSSLSMRYDAAESRLHHMVQDYIVSLQQRLRDFAPRRAFLDGHLEFEAHESFRERVRTVATQTPHPGADPEEMMKFASAMSKKENGLQQILSESLLLLEQLSNADERFEESLRCPVCFTRSKEVASLWPCGHTFCSDCIFDMQFEFGLYRCRLCETVSAEVPLPNIVANHVLARATFKSSGFIDLCDALSTLELDVRRIDDHFMTMSRPYYRTVPPSLEFRDAYGHSAAMIIEPTTPRSKARKSIALE